MKKLLSLFGILVFAITLVACGQTITPTHTASEVMDAIEIGYVEGDSADHITENIILPTTSNLESTARVSWESGNEAVLTSTDVVTRQLEDTTVTLIITVTLGSSSTQKFIDLTVAGTIIYHTVTFDVNGTQTTTRVVDGQMVSQPSDPDVSSYRFNGWFSDSAYQNEYDFDSVVTEDLVIYASMEFFVVGNYSIEVYLENVDDESYTLHSTENLVGEVGVTVNAETIRAGFTINDEMSTISGVVESESDIILQVYFDRIDYQVNFYDGGNLLSTETLKYEELITAITDPTKDEYAFLGWTLSPVSETYYTFGDPVNGNVTLYAQWEISSVYTYEGYYEGADGLSGTNLEAFLRTVVTTGFTGVTYGDARYILDETDADPTNSSKVILVYLGTSVSGAWDLGVTWNREHVWPQSLLGVDAVNSVVNVASDLQNLKPADPSENTSRSNDYFDETGLSGSYEPRDEVKGDVARILFYMTVRYSNLELVNSTNPSVYQMAMLNTLLQWHLQDPVDTFEQHRNDVIYSYQHNRNPFIDHPEFVEKLWGPIELSNGNSIFMNLQTSTDLLITNYVFDIQEIKRDYIC
ncbi:MAG: endonuclease [Firmicutes bacterium]|nr:endonuclease [Bacillota bacterium]